GLPFNQRRLLDCLREGAERFGWAERDPRPRSHHQDGWLIGTGVASATYPAFRQPGSKALIRSVASGYEVAIGAADLGTGTWTALTPVAAAGLAVDPEPIQLALRAPARPPAPGAGGSTGLARWSAAVSPAGRALRREHGTSPAVGGQSTGEAG